ncbi:MAG: tetratricopeptide repeat protein [bacterium]|nr:tetratricopeptide repeat protein [bacterium]
MKIKFFDTYINKKRLILCGLVGLLFLMQPFTANGKNARFYNKQGWKHLERSYAYKAIFSFKNALKQNPKYKEALIGLGKAYHELEAYEQALELFNLALGVDKNDSRAMVGAGLTLTKMGLYTKGLEYFNKAIKAPGKALTAHYGIANLYFTMNKKIWAKRKIDHILRIDPFHYDTLLLMADIKILEKRLGEAKEFAQKAIDSNSESPRGFTKFGEILFHHYLETGNSDSLAEAKYSLKNALSINPKSFRANRVMGNISLAEKNYPLAVSYFEKAQGESPNSSMLYSLAISYDMAGNKAQALKYFLEAYKKTPSDSILRSRLEYFLVYSDYKIGHPARIMLNKEHFQLAGQKRRKNLPSEVIMYLRRTLLLNPMNANAREELMSYYSVLNYNRFYIDEIKSLLRLYPGKKYQDLLSVAVIKRRELLYHKEGYSAETPPRDVPVVLVLDFQSQGTITTHQDAGSVIGNYVSFVMRQYGRMKPLGTRERALAVKGLHRGSGRLEENLEKIGEKIKAGEIAPVDYVVYGNYNETGNRIYLESKLLDFHKGIVIGEFNIFESGKESLPVVSLRAAKRIYGLIPYKGKVLKLKDKGILVNLGLYDGMEPGSQLVIYTKPGLTSKKEGKRSMVFTIRETSTLVSYAEPQKKSYLNKIDSSDTVYPLKKRRAKRIE